MKMGMVIELWNFYIGAKVGTGSQEQCRRQLNVSFVAKWSWQFWQWLLVLSFFLVVTVLPKVQF